MHSIHHSNQLKKIISSKCMEHAGNPRAVTEQGDFLMLTFILFR